MINLTHYPTFIRGVLNEINYQAVNTVTTKIVLYKELLVFGEQAF